MCYVVEVERIQQIQIQQIRDLSRRKTHLVAPMEVKTQHNNALAGPVYFHD